MSKFAPIILNFNGGEVGPLMRGRVDHDDYPSFLEICENYLLSAQGAAVKRPGTIMVAETEEADFASELVDFRYSRDENYILEFGRTHVRFFTDDGLILETEQSGTLSSSTVANVTSHGYSANDYVYISGTSGWKNGKVLKLSGVTANTMTFDEALDVSSGSINVARVYRIAHPYSAADLGNLQFEQSGNVLYIVHEDYQPRKLIRSGNADWAFEAIDFEDGPYEEINAGNTILTLSASGDMGRMSGTTVTASAGTAADAVDGNLNSYISMGNSNQYVRLDLGAGNAKRVSGYVVGAPPDDPATEAPGLWQLQGSDDASTWVTLHEGYAPESWTMGQIRFYELQHGEEYRYYQILVARRFDGAANPIRMSWFGLLPHYDDGETITVTANNTTDINEGDGFSSDDVGRSIRLRDANGYWVWGVITAYSSSTSVSIKLKDFPLTDNLTIGTFRLGSWSGGSKWPTAVTFFQNRQAFVGSRPIRAALSVSDAYSDMTPGDQEGVVADDDGVNVLLNARTGDGAKWAVGTERALLIGTGGAEHVVKSATNDNALSPSNIQAATATRWGSVDVRPVHAGDAVLFFDQTGRRLRELAYVFEADGYRAPNLNLLGHHIFASPVASAAFSATPHPILWAAREDGVVAALTYEREHEVVGWSRQILGGNSDADGTHAVVEKVAGVPSTDATYEEAWFVVKRYINGQTVRYIERTADFYGAHVSQEDAYFVDAGVTYDGVATTTLTDLWWLEGESVVALADGEIITGLTVTNGSVTLPEAASKVHIGYSITSKVKTLPIRGGAIDGTAQGRIKRIHKIVFDLWETYGGRYGPDENTLQDLILDDVTTMTPGEAPPLFTGLTRQLEWPGSYEQEGAIMFVHDFPTPCNLRAFLPLMYVEDAG